MKYLMFFFCGFMITSCQSQVTEGVASEVEGFLSYGAMINDDGVITVEEAIGQLQSKEEAKVKVKGTVETVCKKKGCWMNVQSAAGESIFVRFEDYGFFMPLDCEGAEVIMEGVVFKEITPVDELKHYAEDEGKSKEEIAAITEPKEEFKFTATGVLMKEKS